MRSIYLLLLFCCTAHLACSKPLPVTPESIMLPDQEMISEGALLSAVILNPAHLDTAITFLGVQDDGTNRGPEVNRFLRSVSLPPGNPWCAAFVSYCLQSANVHSPTVRSGLARNYLTKEAISAEKVLRTGMDLEAGTLIGWQRGNTIFGHLGIVKEWNGRCGTTIEGNTSAPNSGGSQFNGGGVHTKERCIEPLAHFRITWFTPVTYN